jgi:hypothetical protein
MTLRPSAHGPARASQSRPRRFRFRLSRRPAELRESGSTGDLLRALQLEIYRSRRSGRRLALIGVQPPAGSSARIGNVIRAIDHARVVAGRLYLLLPETDRRAAYAVAARIEALFEAPVEGGFEVAVFPEDALTAEALMKRVAGRPAAEGERQPLASATTAGRRA